MDTLLPPKSLHDARKQIRIRHLEQLSHANLTLTPPADDDDSMTLPRCKLLSGMLKKWSRDHLKSIQNAVANRALSGKQAINWDYCFLAFMESMTVYLRDWEKLYAAVQTYKDVKAGVRSDVDMHLVDDLYEQSEKGIKEVAAVWGMDFMQICDHKKGASCVGIAFKGTDPTNLRDVAVDLSFEPIQAEASLLFGTVVSEGVYNALFGTFKGKDTRPPFQRVLDALQTFVPTLQGEANTETIFHVTGHSLGGSYSSFCFAQCMMQNAAGDLPAGTQLGDLYNFGSPRVGQQAWSQEFYSNLGGDFPGGAWRIVNDKDIVPQVPSLLKYKPDTGPFYHIDNGIRIYKEAKPTPIPTERNGPGNTDIGLTLPQVIGQLTFSKYHYPVPYYHAMEYALANQ